MTEEFFDCIGKQLEENFYLYKNRDGTSVLSYVSKTSEGYKADLFESNGKETILTPEDAKNLIPIPESIIRAHIKRNPKEANKLEMLLIGVKSKRS
jgi:hypothetical protein